MLSFRRASIEDIPVIREYYDNFNEFSCEFSVVNILLWQEISDFTFCIDDGVLYTRNCIEGRVSFGIPFSRDMKNSIARLKEYCIKENTPLRMFGGQGERMYILKKEFPDSFSFIPVRDSFEYIYSREKLATLSGKKYHSKRNHISSFKKNFEWIYEPLCLENIPKVEELLVKWYELNKEKEDEFMLAEKKGLKYVFENFSSLKGVKGGVLTVEGQAVAFTLGCEISKDVFDVNIEKALTDYNGAYAMINNQFVINELSSYSYINREEDMGIEGLRKAKLSFYPEILLEKYTIVEEIVND